MRNSGLTAGKRTLWRAVGLLVLSLAAAAAPISFPVTLDPNVPNGYVLATYRHACGGCIVDISDEESYLTGATTAQIGVLNLASTASGPGGGAFSDLTHGALGIDSVGFPDGAGEVVEAFLIVNVPLTGAGTNTVDFDISGSSAVESCLNLDCENHFGAFLSVFNPAGVQQNRTQGGCEGTFNCTGIPFPEHLSLTFNSQPGTNIYQFQFALLGTSNGFAGIFATHTGLASLDLAPGVTMDTSSGFLSQPGDPNFGDGSSSVPEPSTPLLGGIGLIALWAASRRRRANGTNPDSRRE